MERAKTIVLTILVLTSIILSLQIRSVQIPVERRLANDIYFGPRPAVPEVVKPNRIYISQDGGFRQVKTLSDMYSTLLTVMTTMEYSGSENWRQESAVPAPPGVLVKFDHPVSKGVLAQLLMNFYEDDIIPTHVTSILIPTRRGPVGFFNAITGEAWYLETELAWELIHEVVHSPDHQQLHPGVWQPLENTEASGQVLDLAQQVYMPVPKIFLEQPETDRIVQSFFLEPAIIRHIQESDGTLIHTDGVKALRVYPSGAIEYTLAKFEPGHGQEQLETLELALEFIGRHGGWREHLMLSQIQLGPDGSMLLEFAAYGHGLPLYSGGGSLALEMGSAAVLSYSRHIAYATEELSQEVPALPLRLLLANPSAQITQLFSTMSGPVTDLSLGYFIIPDGSVYPVWRIVRDQQVVYASASDGRVFLINLPGRGN